MRIDESQGHIIIGLPYFEKQKSGHWMTNFHETKFMAPPTLFSSKAGWWDVVAGLIVEAAVQIRNQTRKLGWSPKKKKKKGHRLLVQRFVSFSSPKVEKCCYRAGVDLSFFGDHPNFCLRYQNCTLPSAIKSATASHHPALVGELIEMSTNFFKSVVFHWSKKRDFRSKKRDKASKSGTYGNPT